MKGMQTLKSLSSQRQGVLAMRVMAVLCASILMLLLSPSLAAQTIAAGDRGAKPEPQDSAAVSISSAVSNHINGNFGTNWEPQQSAVPKCPDGQRYWPGMSTTSMVTKEGCYSLAEYERISNAFFENLCGETGSAWMSWDKQGRMRVETKAASPDLHLAGML